MMHYSVQTRDQIFEKGYGFLSFAKNMGKSIGKNISKNLSGKYSHKPLDHAKELATDALEATSKKVILKIAEAAGDMICNKITDRITKASRSSPQNKSETITNEHEERYIPPEERQKIIDDLKLM